MPKMLTNPPDFLRELTPEDAAIWTAFFNKLNAVNSTRVVPPDDLLPLAVYCDGQGDYCCLFLTETGEQTRQYASDPRDLLELVAEDCGVTLDGIL